MRPLPKIIGAAAQQAFELKRTIRKLERELENARKQAVADRAFQSENARLRAEKETAERERDEARQNAIGWHDAVDTAGTLMELPHGGYSPSEFLEAARAKVDELTLATRDAERRLAQRDEDARRQKVERIEIPASARLDPIRVYLEDYGDGRGRLTVSCFDAAWVAYWSTMGDRTVRQFLCAVSADYIADNLGRASPLKQDRWNRDYLLRISEAVRAALAQEDTT